MNKLLVYRIAGIAVPVVAVALSALLGILQVKRLRKANTDLDNTQKQILSVDGLIRQIESEPPPSKYPTAVASADEQPGFLSTLRSAAETCHVQVTRWTNISEDMQAP
ncbi:MAG TPA: hypothetical protein VGS41_10550, partial [Chthonomonadales bacterium]|nr:hypothetical protein [Chthonomonadales bacterium]